MLEHYQQHEEAIKVLENYAYDESFPPNPNSHVYLYRHLKKLNAPDKKLRRVLQVESTPRVSTSECHVFKIHPIPPCQYSRHHRGAAGFSSSTATIWPLSLNSSLRQTHNRLGHVLSNQILQDQCSSAPAFCPSPNSYQMHLMLTMNYYQKYSVMSLLTVAF